MKLARVLAKNPGKLTITVTTPSDTAAGSQSSDGQQSKHRAPFAGQKASETACSTSRCAHLPCTPGSQVENATDSTVSTAGRSAGAVVCVMSIYVVHSPCHVVSRCELVCPRFLPVEAPGQLAGHTICGSCLEQLLVCQAICPFCRVSVFQGAQCILSLTHTLMYRLQATRRSRFEHCHQYFVFLQLCCFSW